MPPLAILTIRHGESEWNALRQKYASQEERFSSLLYTPDCSLTEHGIQQSRTAGSQLEQYLSDNYGEHIQVLYVVSPLRRALQTALHVQHTCKKFPCLTPPILHPDCTEVMSDSCDIGTVPQELEQEFSDWDFRHMTETFWWPSGKSREETWSLMQSKDIQGKEDEAGILKRLDRLKDYLRSFHNDKLVIVVVCHSEVIWYLTSSMIKGERYGKWTKNGEMLNVTKEILRESVESIESTEDIYCKYDKVDQLLL